MKKRSKILTVIIATVLALSLSGCLLTYNLTDLAVMSAVFGVGYSQS